MEEDLQRIIKILCSDSNRILTESNIFKGICSDVIKSIYKVDILINTCIKSIDGKDQSNGYIFETNIIGYNNYGNRLLVKIVVKMNDNKDIDVNITNRE